MQEQFGLRQGWECGDGLYWEGMFGSGRIQEEMWVWVLSDQIHF